MNRLQPEIGRAAVSKAGRDKGRWMLIVKRFDEEHVLVADGDLRKIANPKKKKLRHLYLKPFVAQEVRACLLDGTSVLDADIRKALDAMVSPQE